ncbi:MAG: response regulator transcription factor [Minwuiales bacterium]|nr:response regulator transcription factor [Minwuiales bacterium]
MSTDDATIFVVDDDDAVRESMQALLESVGYRVEVFGRGREFLDAYATPRPGCLLLDVRMPDLSGLEIQQQLRAGPDRLPIIIITGHGDVPMAVTAMKAGAFDFIEKPFNEDVLLETIKRALALIDEKRIDDASIEDSANRIAGLTPREREVLDQLLIGRQNKAIAAELGISPRTVEIHRARVMQKMQANSLSHLIRMALQAGVGPGASETA